MRELQKMNFENIGYQVVAKNVRADNGEIDLVVNDHNQILLGELKSRSNKNIGFTEEATPPQNMEHMRQSAQKLIGYYPGDHHTWRRDVMPIFIANGNAPQIEWFENVDQ